MEHKGLTVLEILFAISILTLAVTIVAFSFSKLNSKQALDRSADLVVSILDDARSLTLSSKGGSQYGVQFEASQVILFKGVAYSSSDSSNVVTELNPMVGLRNVVLSGGGVSVVFERLTGNTNHAGSVEVFLKAVPETLRTISISATGVSNVIF
ncbi:MAG: hypothetical protein A3C70_03490 [Candidatus Zambryskibacteria bacterium RIFCSPHIGHO2_02_FULL_43_14]|uniref:General secretion pathway GspH domain-containing protein n=1 Tax=Candidatus Zambryskibacteria bacterium RIFCSPHIGHO2_02_FULL_43_14 TaxID=1802748 RepID=A0A1G2THL7_9BACT|nr:MAG: hypothetical protein A2829_00935 [Candidatus Zambryskibacteria bacterium RIFCSPHIGHO2_01_FULL_43_60]OHA96149.1 MAG: hypothetical protein A3C70_03490 [Candidatus Zambryskibacteria bacterium RIFCSPHIGHO2_02_FULL_43_14]OHB03149.1 MAG: hypothetical protein A3B03_01775 [Candidatus Zambryskibacteria bacterium RIFCSPLOWO2_01_FULL_42_41]